MKTIEALYIYDKDLGTLDQVIGCRYDTKIFGQGTSNETIHYYAEIPVKKFRVEIAKKSEEVYADPYKNALIVWLHEINRDKAIEIIGNYILDQIGEEIRTHRSFLDRLHEDLKKASNLIESLPHV